MLHFEMAIYGSRSGSHGLLSSSIAEKSLPPRLSGMVDKPPGMLPPGVRWSPAFGCGPVGDFYVLWRSIEDERGRAGMVQSHALLIPLPLLESVQDLRPLLSALPNTLQASPSAEALQFSQADLSATEPADPAGYAVLARLLEGGQSAGVVIPSDADSESLIAALWLRLWPGARRRLTCQTVLGAGQLGTPPPSLVITPRETLPSWHGHPTLADPPAPSTTGAPSFLGAAPSEEVSTLLRDLQPADFGLDKLGLLKGLAPLHREWQGGQAPMAGRILLLRRTLSLCPHPSAASGLKRALGEDVAQGLASASLQDVLSLSNLTPGQPTLERALGEAVEERLLALLGDLKPSKLLEVLRRPEQQGIAEWWRGAARRAWEMWSTTAHVKKAEQVWSGIGGEPRLLDHLPHRVPASSTWEQALLDRRPAKLDAEVTEACLLWAAHQGWPRLHGALLPSIYTPLQSLKRQRALIGEGGEGMGELAAQLVDDDLIGLYVTSQDGALLPHATARLSKQPTLLRGLHASEPGWRRLWLDALRGGLDPQRGVLPFEEAFHELLDQLLRGTPIEDELLTRLIQGGLSGLHHPGRSTLWGHLPPQIREPLLSATAEAWLKVALESGIDEVHEAPLKESITHRFNRGPGPLSASPPQITAIIQALDTVTERGALAWLQGWWRQVGSRSASVDTLAAAELGRICAKREWREVIRWVYKERSTRNALEPLLIEAQTLLHIWEKWGLGAYSIPEDEWWLALESCATSLYKLGPFEGTIWEDAGGDISDLSREGSAKEQWRWVIAKVRQGGILAKGPKRLLRAMSRHFPSNEQLKLLQDRAPWKNR